MRAASRLSINNVFGRPSRSLLLTAAVALSCVLVTAVACALASLNAGLEYRVATTIGNAQLRVKHIGERRFDDGVLDVLRAQPEARLLAPRSRGPLPLLNARNPDDPGDDLRDVAVCEAIDPSVEYEVVLPGVDEGRAVERDGEVVLVERLAESLGVGVGDTLEVERFGPPLFVEVVGVRRPKTLEPVEGAWATTTLATLEDATGFKGSLRQVDVVLQDDVVAEEVVDRWQAQMPDGLVVTLTERSSSGIGQSIRANQFAYLLASAISFLAASFIVLTGLTTSLAERQRELAVMRCVGATRGQLALSQVLTGGLIGLGGAALGVPAGIALAWLLIQIFHDRLPAGLVIWPIGLAMAIGGAGASGVIGALWPAWMASRVRPLVAMASSATPVRTKSVALLGALGLAGIALQIVIVSSIEAPDVLFFVYLLVGVPAMFIGYFLIGPAVALGVVRLVAPVLARVLRLPRVLLTGNARATPIRAGFTAGSLMVGLMLMTIIWTNGTAMLRDWVSNIMFPDAFANALDAPFTTRDQAKIEGLPFVRDTCAITLQKVESDAFGVRSVRAVKTTFIAFEPGPFFGMARLHWIAGDRDYAIARLNGAERETKGPAVLVAKEFLVNREGYAIGDTFSVDHLGERIDFEIVGAVQSPGLDLINKYFDIGKEYADQAIHSVFGSRDELKRLFGNDSIDLIQIALHDDAQVGDAEVGDEVRALFPGRSIAAGSGREIKEGIIALGRGWMTIASTIAIGAMLIGCAGVGNIVVAGIDARRFEFGVMRAVGANGGLLARLIVGEVVLVALTACVLGTLIGVQAAWAEQVLFELVAGLELRLRPPALPIAAGWVILVSLTLLAVTPIVARLRSRQTIDLLRAR